MRWPWLLLSTPLAACAAAGTDRDPLLDDAVAETSSPTPAVANTGSQSPDAEQTPEPQPEVPLDVGEPEFTIAPSEPAMVGEPTTPSSEPAPNPVASSDPEPHPPVTPLPNSEPESTVPAPSTVNPASVPVVAPSCPPAGVLSDPCDAPALFAADGVVGDGCSGSGACHGSGEAQVPDLVSPGVVERLLNQRGRGAGCSSYVYFDPDAIEDSLVLMKTLGTHGTCGGIMPPRPGRLGCKLDPVNAECIRLFLTDAASAL